jgi:predicted DNA-binding transcriptional regulator AlpA
MEPANHEARKSDATIPDALRHFDLLPDSASVRQPVVVALFGFSPATLWRRVKAGKVPAPKKDGAITSWNVGELRKCRQQG